MVHCSLSLSQKSIVPVECLVKRNRHFFAMANNWRFRELSLAVNEKKSVLYLSRKSSLDFSGPFFLKGSMDKSQYICKPMYYYEIARFTGTIYRMFMGTVDGG